MGTRRELDTRAAHLLPATTHLTSRVVREGDKDNRQVVRRLDVGRSADKRTTDRFITTRNPGELQVSGIYTVWQECGLTRHLILCQDSVHSDLSDLSV